jgi:hypothetical protein
MGRTLQMKASALSRCGQNGALLLGFFFVTLCRNAPAVALSTNKFDELVDLRLRRVQEACGQLCNMSAANLVPGSPFGHVQQHILCKAIWNESGIDAQRETNQAPATLPNAWVDEFTMGGRYPMANFCRETRHPGCNSAGVLDSRYLGHKARTPVWGRAWVDSIVSQARSHTLGGTYGLEETGRLRDALLFDQGVAIKGARVLVIGSENPWVEALCLSVGAAEVTTLEYGAIRTDHPQLKTFTPDAFRSAYLAGSIHPFDIVVTFSSLEHSGLGRYGDALNPWGDIIAVARSWCVTKQKAKLIIGVMYNLEHEGIKFNAHREYGNVRYPYLATNWRLLWRHPSPTGQRVHVFEKHGHQKSE